MEHVNFSIAPAAIQNLPGFSTKRASKEGLLEMFPIVAAALQVPLTIAERSAAVICLRCAEFSAQKLLPSAELLNSKFPRNLEDIWPYLSYPLAETAQNLGLSPRTLEDKAMRYGGYEEWPPSSTPRFIQVYVQLFDGVVVRHRHFKCPRMIDYEDLCEEIGRHFFPGVPRQLNVYVDVNGVRWGPIFNDIGWRVIVDLATSIHRISLYVDATE